jgi:hypothetical protein
VRWKFGSPLEAIRQEWALSSKETVATVSPASLVKFVIFVDISASPQCGRAEMVWPITGAKSYVCETGKSIKAVELAVFQKGCWRKIPVTLEQPTRL